MKKTLVILSLTLMVAVAVQARTRTTQSKLGNAKAVVEMIEPDSCSLDSIEGVDPHAVTMRGFSKRASDSKESFFLTNNTRHRISHVRLLMRYSSMQGEMLHEREVMVPVALKPGETRMVAVRSFDVQRMFYYYGGPQPRKVATPFKVAFRLLGYDIPVGKL
jgi:hypothetical protein